MKKPYRQTDEEYIVVHRLHGDQDAIDYLKEGSHLRTEELLYRAKRRGQSTFHIRGTAYVINHDRDNSYTIVAADDDLVI